MNDIDYLNEIAKDNRAASPKNNTNKFIDPKWLKILGFGIAGVIVLIILGGILGNLGNGNRDLLDRIYARSTNLTTTLSEYTNRVKSSELRAMGNSLSTVLRETSSKVSSLIVSEYGAEDGTVPRDENIPTEESSHIEEINTSLYYGRINGFLDRYYVREMTKEIALLMSLESEAIEKISSLPITEALSASWNNLSQLETQFKNYESNQS